MEPFAASGLNFPAVAAPEFYTFLQSYRQNTGAYKLTLELRRWLERFWADFHWVLLPGTPGTVCRIRIEFSCRRGARIRHFPAEL